ncbi:hypothetical protein PENSPDRAFT_655740 [Peniophora sp. CONT]|nr:hypothetical protein PENSPDRAFT_655740 [Peniophora sp. CONT]
MSEPVVYNAPVSPIWRLPDELFYLIFNELCTIYPAGGRNRLGWISSTFVCSRWRRVAIEDCAALWGRSLCALPKAFSTIVERARDAQLTIRFDEPDNRMTGAQSFVETGPLTKALLGLFERRPKQMQSVRITFPAYRLRAPSHNFDALNDNDDVNLDLIDMGVNFDEDPGVQAQNQLMGKRGQRASLFSAAALSALLGHSLPDLQHLELIYDAHYCPVISTAITDHSAFFAPSLLSLKLFRQQFPIKTLYDVLQNSPLLETLAIQWAGDDAPSMLADLPRLVEPIDLPRLTDVFLGGREVNSTAILSLWCLLRAHVDVRLHLMAALDMLPQGENSFTALVPWLRRTGGDTLSTLLSTRGLGLGLSSSSSHRSNPQPYVYIEYAALLPMAQFSPFLSHFITSIDPARIRKLNFDIDLPLMPDSVAELARLTMLEEVRVSFNPDESLAELAEMEELRLLSEPNVAPLFPALKTLVLKDINLTPATRWDADGRFVVVDLLQLRKDAGVPVKKVVLRGMRFGSNSVEENEELNRLGGHVDEVVDERRDESEGIEEIKADENFL